MIQHFSAHLFLVLFCFVSGLLVCWLVYGLGGFVCLFAYSGFCSGFGFFLDKMRQTITQQGEILLAQLTY